LFFIPLFGLFATAGIIFLLAKGGGDNRPRLDGKIRSTRERKIFTDHTRRQPALAGLEQPVYLCGKMQSPQVAQCEWSEWQLKEGGVKGVNGICREVRRKGGGVL